jgi:CHASE1-domain containing sensor protein
MGEERQAPRDSLTTALPIVLVALLLVGALAVSLAVLRERDNASTAEEEITELVRRDLTATIDEMFAALAGGSAIADAGDDGFTLERWELFARDAVDASVMVSLALELPVSDDERAEFERTIGGPIREAGPDGLRPSAERDSYLPVRSVVPLNDQTREVIGFDIASDAVRRDAAARARELGAAVISAPLNTQPSGQPAFFVNKPLYARTQPDTSQPAAPGPDEILGYMSTAVTGAMLVEDAAPLLPAGTRFTVRDGGVSVGSTDPAPRSGRTAMVAVADREWELLVDDGKRPNYSFAWLIGWATLLLIATVAIALRTRIDAQRQRTRNATRLAKSADLAQRLAEARTTDAVAEAVSAEVPLLLSATQAGVRTVDPATGTLVPVMDEDLPSGLLGDDAIPIDASTPPGRAILEHRWILLEDVSTHAATYGQSLVDTLADNKFCALACIPLEDDEGDVVGLLGVAWETPQRFDDTTRALLRTVAELCQQTLERARLHDTEHQLVVQLQESALSPPPSLGDFEMSVRYQSAVQTLTMGGDWYDAIALSEHRVALVVGDVAGHGIPAVAEMIELRSVIHALLRSAHPIDQVVSVADDILDSATQTRIATALIAVFDSKERTVEYVSAGHPPALLRAPDGEVEVLLDGRRTVLGMSPPTPSAVGVRRFEPGATFVAYTDGLIERRDEDLMASVDRLAHDLSPTTLRGEQLADAILAGHAPDGTATDDIALVVVHAT